MKKNCIICNKRFFAKGNRRVCISHKFITCEFCKKPFEKKNGLVKRIYCSIKCKNTIHGMYGTKFYNTWMHIKTRCFNSKDIMFSYYGGRGIKCLWNSFKEFRDDMYESYLKHVAEFGEKQTTIDRIDNDGNYCKENCRWATLQEQQINRSTTHFLTFKGQTKHIAEWARILGINGQTLHERIKRGWDTNHVLSKIF